MSPIATDRAGTAGRIQVELFDTDQLTAEIDDWDELVPFERWLVLRDPDEFDVSDITLERASIEISEERAEELLAIEPPESETIKTRNTTLDGLNEYIVDDLDPDQAVDLDASHMAFGTDGASGTSTGDTGLNNEVYRTSVTDVIDNGKDLKCSTFLDSSEANGNDIDEVGVVSDDPGGTFLNHATLSVIQKDASDTATVDVILEFRAA